MNIIFRGRNTEGIAQDAEGAGALHGYTVIVSRKNDPLAQEFDRTVEGMLSMLENNPNTWVVLFANGGTTAQLVPILVHLTTKHKGPVKVYDCQREGVSLLVDIPARESPKYMVSCYLTEQEHVQDFYNSLEKAKERAEWYKQFDAKSIFVSEVKEYHDLFNFTRAKMDNPQG